MYDEYEYDDILCHHGVKGQKWGVIRSARQLGHDISSKAKARKVSSVAKKKEDLIRSGDPNKILKNRKLFSDDEFDRILSRIQKMKEVESYGPQKVKKVERQPQQKSQPQQQQGPKPTKSMTQQLDSAAKVLKTVAGMYSSYKIISQAVNTMAGKDVFPDPTKALKSFGKSGKGDSDTSEKKSSKKEEKAASKSDSESNNTNFIPPHTSSWESGSSETKTHTVPGGSQQTTTSSQSKRSAFDSSDYSNLYSGKNTTSAQWEEVTDAFKSAFNSMPKNDSTVDMFFDAATGSYKAGTGESTSSGSWTQKMNVPVSGWLNSNNLPDIIR